MYYDDLDEAVAIANDTEFGLSAGVWSRDEAKPSTSPGGWRRGWSR
jgi:acyl-CoA reductase-like NAD-dependent aldehyde dehydrogenase